MKKFFTVAIAALLLSSCGYYSKVYKGSAGKEARRAGHGCPGTYVKG